jgi:hypothetical protein
MKNEDINITKIDRLEEKETIPTNYSYNFMNDDIDDDIDFQIYIENGSSIGDGDSSEHKSDLEGSDDSNPNPMIISHKKNYKKLTYEEVEYSIKKYYFNDKYNHELDMLITFIKGQKHIFRQSFYLTQRKVAFLVTPCLFITGSIIIIAPIIQPFFWSGYLLSGLNAILTIFISILNFWNLQFVMMQYSVYCSHFDRLETSLVLTRNQLFLLENNQKKTEIILNKIRETETRMMEMKEDHPIYIPTEVKIQVPNISHIDIFAFIQKINQNTKNLIIEYKDIKNEIRYIMYKWKLRDNQVFDNNNNDNYDNLSYERMPPSKNQNQYHETFYRSFINLENNNVARKEHERQRLTDLIHQKEKIKKEIINNHKKYSYIDNIFAKEIEISEKNQNNFWFLFWYYIPCFSTFTNTSNINDNINDNNNIKTQLSFENI